MKPAKIYDFTLTANGSFVLPVEGDYFKVLSATGLVEVTGDSFGSLGSVLPGQGLDNTPFKRLVIKDKTGSANIGTLLVADEKFIDDRITGEVSVIDGGAWRSKSNKSFLGTGYSTCGAAQFSAVQLWNPAGTGSNLIVKSIRYSVNVAATIVIKTNTAAAGIAAGPGGSKFIDGADDVVGAVRDYSNGGALLSISKGLGVDQFAAGGVGVVTYQEPLILGPGKGIWVGGNVAGALNISAVFDYYIEPQ